jgi:hypothetical protein
MNRPRANMVRNCKLKAEKGWRKDLRKIDSLIREVHAITHLGATEVGR